MTRNVLHITLHSTIKESDKTVEAILQKIQTIRQNVAELRDTNLELERARDQYHIHLSQCTEDHHILSQIYKTLKMKLQISTAEDQKPINLQAQPISSPHDFLSDNNHSSQPFPSSVPLTKLIPTIESIKLEPQVTSTSKTPPNVTLRYALNTSTMITISAFSSDGSKLAFEDNQYVYIATTQDGDIFSLIQLNHPMQSSAETLRTRALKFSPNDEFLAVAVMNQIYLYETETQKLVHTFSAHTKEVSSIVFNEDGSRLISGGLDQMIYIWDMKTYEQINQLSHKSIDSGIIQIATTPDIQFYAIGFASGAIGIYNESFTSPMTSFDAHSQELMNIAVSPLDCSLATASKDKTVKVWSMGRVASSKFSLETHSDVVLTVNFSPTTNTLISGSKDQTLKMWDYKTGQELCTIIAHHNTVYRVEHHPQSNTFVSCSGDGVVCLWDYQLQ